MSEPCSLFWLDLETTGLDIPHEHLLEAACFISDPDGRNPRDHKVWIIKPPYFMHWENKMVPFVKDMHTNSGLLEAVESEGIAPSEFRDEMHDYLIKHLERDSRTVGHKLTMAGSGVGPFDRIFFKTHFPMFEPFLNYYVLDVGVIGRFIRQSTDIEMDERKSVGHRAADDIADHYEEFVYYRDYLNLLELYRDST